MTAQTFLAAATAAIVIAPAAFGQTKPDSSKTQIVFLGTGNPSANPDRSGPSLAIVVHGSSYIVDAGPGVVRRAVAASRAGVGALALPNLKRVFITHLHSDHTLGLPDLMYTPWVMRRVDPLEVYGPPGISAMVHHLEMAYREDNDIRINGLEHQDTTGNKINVHEIKPGVVYKDANVTVTAFPVPHGSWKYSFGYRFVTSDRTIVVTGDTHPSESIVEACNGCDALVSEVYTEKGYADSDTAWRSYVRSFHISTKELADVAARAKPKLLILTHQMWFGKRDDNEQSMLAELKKYYGGRIASAHDLDIF